MPIRFLIIIALLLLAEYYAFVVVRGAVRNFPQGWRITLLTLYALGTLSVWAGVFLFRYLNWANVPHFLRNLYIAFAIGFSVGKLLILAVMLIDDIRRLVLWVINIFFTAGTTEPAVIDGTQGRGITRSVFLSRLALIMGGVALGGFVYGISNRYNYHVRKLKLKLAKLPAAFKGLRIVQISDIHSGSFDDHAAVQRGIDKIMELKPDVILFTGDLVNNKAEEVVPYMDIFSQLKAPLGVFSTLGNHDYADYVAEWHDQPQLKRENLQRLMSHHAEMGWRLLMNEHVMLEKDGAQIALLGIENWSNKQQFPKYGRMNEAYAGLENRGDLVKILMSHDPSHWDGEVLEKYKDIDLTLSGHTHGMQFGVEIPGLRVKWSPVQYVYKNWAGMYTSNNQHLYVNRGFGFLGYSGRLGILPEITLIELA